MRSDPEVRREIERVLDAEPALSAMSQLDRIDLADRCAEAAEAAHLAAHHIGAEPW